MIEHFAITVISSVGLATLIVEKGDDFPVKLIRDPLSKLVFLILGEKWYTVFFCTVCMSFWTSLICELIMYCIYDGIFLWPLSGFAASGIAFYLIDFLNTIDARKVTNEKEEA